MSAAVDAHVERIASELRLNEKQVRAGALSMKTKS
jgi:hypothetical protein